MSITAQYCYDNLRTRRLGIGAYEITTHDGEVFTVADYYPDETESSMGRRQWGIRSEAGEPLEANSTLTECKVDIARWTYYRLTD